MVKLVIWVISLYQHTLSPDHGWMRSRYPGGYCRYHPTCSEYAKQAITTHGLIKGGFLSAARLSRCHPWAHSGFDPVPQ